MRGADGILVVALFGGSGALCGGLVGLVAGAAWTGVGAGDLAPSIAATIAGLAVAADVARLRPLAVRRQVPQAWGRLFGVRLTAVLYGARLGVGPLTILRTWTWWAALVIGASLGAWPSAVVHVVFAVTRTASTMAVGARAGDGGTMGRRVERLTAAEPVALRALLAGVAVLALGTALA